MRITKFLPYTVCSVLVMTVITCEAGTRIVNKGQANPHYKTVKIGAQLPQTETVFNRSKNQIYSYSNNTYYTCGGGRWKLNNAVYQCAQTLSSLLANCIQAANLQEACGGVILISRGDSSFTPAFPSGNGGREFIFYNGTGSANQQSSYFIVTSSNNTTYCNVFSPGGANYQQYLCH